MHVGSCRNEVIRYGVVEVVHARVITGVVQGGLAETVLDAEVCLSRCKQLDGAVLAKLHRDMQSGCS